MDNQQESSIDIGWLCGIIDGEGTVTLRFKRRKNQSPIITPVVSIVNTNKIIIDKILEILKKYEIAFYVHEYTSPNKHWKTRWEIQVLGIKRVKKILPIITKYLVGKKEQAQIMQQWVDARYNELGKRTYYTEWDLEMVKKIKLLHTHQDLVEKSIEILRDYMPSAAK